MSNSKTYRVVSLYPNCPFYIGSILELNPLTGKFQQVIGNSNGTTKIFGGPGVYDPENHPAIFKQQNS